MPFVYDDQGYLTNQKCFIITGKHTAFLTAFFNSSLFKYCFRDNFPELQGGTRELSKIFFDKIPILKITDDANKMFEETIIDIQQLKSKNIDTKNREIEVDNMISHLYDLTNEEQQVIGFIEIQ
jgi:hypothetical protein